MHAKPFAADHRLFQALLRRSQPVQIDEQRTLFNQGDLPQGVLLLVAGEVALLMFSSAGKLVTSFRADPGSVLGRFSRPCSRAYARWTFRASLARS
jgi:CRP-like cAMP-binding protein